MRLRYPGPGIHIGARRPTYSYSAAGRCPCMRNSFPPNDLFINVGWLKLDEDPRSPIRKIAIEKTGTTNFKSTLITLYIPRCGPNYRNLDV